MVSLLPRPFEPLAGGGRIELQFGRFEHIRQGVASMRSNDHEAERLQMEVIRGTGGRPNQHQDFIVRGAGCHQMPGWRRPSGPHAL